MKKEPSPTLDTERVNDAKEGVLYGHFLIIDDKNRYARRNEPELQEGKIIHYLNVINFLDGDKRFHRFKLLKQIGGLEYIFTLAESFGSYSVSFKTKKYEYAIVGLHPEDRDVLFRTLADFIKSVAEFDQNIKEIMASPADAPYSRKEMEACIEEILTSPNNQLTKEEIVSEYRGNQVFDLYFRLFDKVFERSLKQRHRSGGRSRLFKSMFRKYLPGWEISNDFSIGHDFVLKRR
ncbi:MAG: hypothetical protein A3A13_03860 [Candidatus Yanofskybacteria bacterium RIFCSPLOWO2_01_FULL_43_22]|uniref:Uncharacterized protein n=1 Tax=Candidatus Yanofskybacteria bacterium RIFCSPLOWO2_01_FULL_43_22 TaxID=1802695 RepID=A0A1F8GFX0_9BACT|nr:MAG: hypothetical protein A3D48_00410 [Candidatus Yanofskybacteria bacterium RIFCSPHIGHO2_02_FULL_43_17]OGN24285.1 MAG: hypothetical protein A3A13_03860 [Candidatus Yanofskybacteria bacterium RIFCSPLOWO2_01_FULL_43_22]